MTDPEHNHCELSEIVQADGSFKHPCWCGSYILMQGRVITVHHRDRIARAIDAKYEDALEQTEQLRILGPYVTEWIPEG